MTPEEQIRRLKESLSLTDAQAVKVLKIYGNWQEEMWNVFESGEENRETMREAMMVIMKEVDKQIDSLLTADQKSNLICLGMSV
jgi:Spy/CpxP family protein refolding chaperone